MLPHDPCVPPCHSYVLSVFSMSHMSFHGTRCLLLCIFLLLCPPCPLSFYYVSLYSPLLSFISPPMSPLCPLLGPLTCSICPTYFIPCSLLCPFLYPLSLMYHSMSICHPNAPIPLPKFPYVTSYAPYVSPIYCISTPISPHVPIPPLVSPYIPSNFPLWPLPYFDWLRLPINQPMKSDV